MGPMTIPSNKPKTTLAVSICLLVFKKHVTFRVQTAPFDKERLISGDLGSVYTFPTSSKPKLKQSDQHLSRGQCFFIELVSFRVQTAPLDKTIIDFWRSRKRLHDSGLLKARKQNQTNILT